MKTLRNWYKRNRFMIALTAIDFCLLALLLGVLLFYANELAR